MEKVHFTGIPPFPSYFSSLLMIDLRRPGKKFLFPANRDPPSFTKNGDALDVPLSLAPSSQKRFFPTFSFFISFD